jgi:hypothetical protein
MLALHMADRSFTGEHEGRGAARLTPSTDRLMCQTAPGPRPVRDSTERSTGAGKAPQ